ncbi:unnamed protein product, partial [Brassica oleracea var. botrytis]
HLENALLQICGFICWEWCRVWLSFWSEVHYNSLYDIEAVPGSAEAKEKTLVVLESKPLTWTTSSYYFLSIVHKPTVSDALTLPSYLYIHELA